MITFEINDRDEKIIKEWIEKIRVEPMNNVMDYVMYFPDLTFIFHPLSIGIGEEVIVRENLTKKEINLTNIDDW